MHKTGSVVLLNNKKGLFGWLIRKVTGAPYTHCAITMGKIIPKCDSILTAETLITVHPLQQYYDTPHYEFSIYEINVKESILEAVVLDLYEKRALRGYAFWQNLWFVYRRIAEKFGYDVRKQKNWFPKSDNCSEETYDMLVEIAKAAQLRALEFKLQEWNSNTFSPVDFKTVADQYPKIFKEVK
jgi:hypothetical protein